MRAIDFLSDSPRNYIFKKEVNKTNFGGVLFLIYCLIMLIIILTYILDYALNEKYEIEYFDIRNQTNLNDFPALESDPVYNPKLEFQISAGIFSEKLDNLSMIYIENNKLYFSHKTNYSWGIDTLFKGFYANQSVSGLEMCL